jgi:uncharacterized protein
MDMTGEQRIAAPRAMVWAALNDPDVLKECIPGCQALEQVGDHGFKATAVLAVGPVKATFHGNVTLSDIDAPNGYTITGEGAGGPAGFAKGHARVQLADDGDGTLLTYTVKADIGGKLAQLGSRLIDSTAKKMATDFFKTFDQVVAPHTADNADAEHPSTERRKGLWGKLFGGKAKA